MARKNHRYRFRACTKTHGEIDTSGRYGYALGCNTNLGICSSFGDQGVERKTGPTHLTRKAALNISLKRAFSSLPRCTFILLSLFLFSRCGDGERKKRLGGGIHRLLLGGGGRGSLSRGPFCWSEFYWRARELDSEGLIRLLIILIRFFH